MGAAQGRSQERAGFLLCQATGWCPTGGALLPLQLKSWPLRLWEGQISVSESTVQSLNRGVRPMDSIFLHHGLVTGESRLSDSGVYVTMSTMACFYFFHLVPSIVNC